ncbi:phage protease [Campylobacter sp. FOBRC14]|uniref:phage protease n=1 Tax=Campylobacter sp. FOBRC14 TaxID=936554 RepID=UPI00027A364D|nr:phage protease [Campylobacter sp. FOBRC14]EJP75865.1 Mu-like prophage I protein [Campylobacter sp. FOBRC14]
MDGVKCKSLLALNFKENEALKISPIGEITGLDGRVFNIDAKTLLESIAKNNLHIPLDENHNFGGAVGWFDKDSFEAREDGIYAKLELNKNGKALVEDKIYRYLSPVYDVSGKNVIGLDSIGLVNRPNLLNNTINSKGETMQKELEELKAKNEALQKELDEIKAKAKEAENKEPEPKSDDQGKEANEKQLNSLSKSVDEINKRLDKLDDTLGLFFGKKDLEKNTKGSGLSEDELKMAKMLGLSEDEFKGGK